MSRSGYNEDCDDNWALICWRGAVTSAIKGRRGQEFLREMAAALDAMSEKRLIANDLIQPGGGVCAIGAVGAARGIDMDKLDPEDRETVASTFGIAPALAAEIVFMNDECGWRAETPEGRWSRMRSWVSAHLVGAT